jgi:hypothetical protein
MPGIGPPVIVVEVNERGGLVNVTMPERAATLSALDIVGTERFGCRTSRKLDISSRAKTSVALATSIRDGES